MDTNMDTNKSLQPGQGAGLLLVMAGAFFLLTQVFGLGRWGWPFFIILPGLALFAAAFLGGRRAASLAIPASIVTTVGLILFHQNVTGRFETWAYAWALIFPTAIGLGTFLQGLWSGNDKTMAQGRKMGTFGLMVFLGFALFFEVLIFGTVAGGALGRVVLPLLLIAAGVVLMRRGGSLGQAGLPEPEPTGAARAADERTV